MQRTVRLALGMFAMFAAGAAVAAESEYFPLKKDSKWVYKVGDTTIEVKVASVDEKDGAKLETIVNGKSVASEMVMVEADGVYRTKINTAAIEPKVKFLELKDGMPEDKESKWTVDSKIQEQAVKGTFTMAGKPEKVKILDKEYPEVVVVNGPDFEIAGTKTAVKYWFAKGTGIVKLSYSIGGNEAVLELQEYTAGK